MDISNRFEIMIGKLEMNNNSFALSIGKSPSNIKPIIDGKSKPGYEMLEAIFKKYPQINRDWLLMGEGEIFRTTKKIDKIEMQTFDALPVMWNSLKENYEKTIDDLRYTVNLQKHLLNNSFMGKQSSNVHPQMGKYRKLNIRVLRTKREEKKCI